MSKWPSPFRCAARCTAGYPKYPSGKPHGGEDWVPEDKSTDSNWRLYAVSDAKVYISKKQTGPYKGYGAYGNYIVYQCPNGYWVLMAHMTTVPRAKAGSTIKQGDWLGTAGATGNVSGRHLHIEVSDMRGVSYNGATWYDKFVEHRVKPSDFIDFNNYDPSGGDFDVKTWTNGSTKELVFQTTADCKAQKNHIGSLAPREKCECYGIVEGVYLVAYKIDGSTAQKCGFVKYSGGVK